MGAATETELKDKKLRYEDALNAVKSALECGIVPGGGVAAQADAGPLGVEQPHAQAPGADHGANARGSIDAEAAAWYWHELALVHAAARAHAVVERADRRRIPPQRYMTAI